MITTYIHGYNISYTRLNSILSFRIIWAAARQNQQNDLCAQQRLRSAWVDLRSAWASAQSDQSLRCLHEQALGLQFKAHSEGSDQTGLMPRLIRVFAGRTSQIVGFAHIISVSIKEQQSHQAVVAEQVLPDPVDFPEAEVVDFQAAEVEVAPEAEVAVFLVDFQAAEVEVAPEAEVAVFLGAEVGVSQDPEVEAVVLLLTLWPVSHLAWYTRMDAFFAHAQV